MNPVTMIMAAVVAIGAAYGVGRWQGHGIGHDAATREFEQERIAAQRDVFSMGEAIRARADALRAANEEHRNLLEEIEHEIANDPDSGRPGISGAGLRRLERALAAP